MAEPLISVGMPVYNGGRYLGRALDSVLAQSHQRVEILVSDNASSDETLQVANRYAAADRRISVIRQPVNRGGSRNFTEVLRRARGEYFVWLAHDDRWDPSFLESCLEKLEPDPSVVVCHSAGSYVTPSGRSRRLHRLELSNVDDDPLVRWRTVLRHWELAAAVHGLMRTDAAQRTRGMLPVPGSDAIFIAEISLLGKIVQTDELLHHKHVPEEGARYRSPYEMAVYMGGKPSLSVLVRGSMLRARVLRESVRALRVLELSRPERLRLGSVAARLYFGAGYWKVDVKEAVRQLPHVRDAARMR